MTTKEDQYTIATTLDVDAEINLRTQDLYYHSSTVVQNVVQKKGSFNPGRFCEQKVDKGLVCQCCGM